MFCPRAPSPRLFITDFSCFKIVKTKLRGHNFCQARREQSTILQFDTDGEGLVQITSQKSLSFKTCSSRRYITGTGDDIYDGVLSDKIWKVSDTRVGRVLTHFIGPPNSLKV